MCKCLLCLLAIVLPPLAVLLNEGCTCNLLINFLLTLLGLVPGVIHAWYLILCQEQRVVNYYIASTSTTTPAPQYGQAPPAYTA